MRQSVAHQRIDLTYPLGPLPALGYLHVILTTLHQLHRLRRFVNPSPRPTRLSSRADRLAQSGLKKESDRMSYNRDAKRGSVRGTSDMLYSFGRDDGCGRGAAGFTVITVFGAGQSGAQGGVTYVAPNSSPAPPAAPAEVTATSQKWSAVTV